MGTSSQHAEVVSDRGGSSEIDSEDDSTGSTGYSSSMEDSDTESEDLLPGRCGSPMGFLGGRGHGKVTVCVQQCCVRTTRVRFSAPRDDGLMLAEHCGKRVWQV